MYYYKPKKKISGIVMYSIDQKKSIKPFVLG